ncbi:MAG TPA: hypothetical protein VLL52_16330 [Anaerolineae bacterium]|nr:hypothetical protein [Anaerolineae bacterium]
MKKFTNLGYTIRYQDTNIYFEYRPINTPALLTLVLFGFSVIMGSNVLYWLINGTGNQTMPVIVATLTVAILLVVATLMSFRIYQERRSIPSEDALVAIADLEAGVLLSPQKKPLCALYELTVRQQLDPLDGVQGFTYFVCLEWNDESLRIYKSGRVRERRELKALLESLLYAPPKS